MRKTRLEKPEMIILTAARARAKMFGMDFSITKDDIYIPTHCPVLGIEIRVGHEIADYRPCLDRILNHVGYVPGNVVVVSHRVNRIKSDSTPEELRHIAQFYEMI